MRSAVRFQLEQLSLPVEPKAKAAETGISDDSMTRYHEQQPVCRASLPDGTKCASILQFHSQFAVSQHGAARNRSHSLAHPLHERSACVLSALISTETRAHFVE